MNLGEPGSDERRAYNRDAQERSRATFPACRKCGGRDFTLRRSRSSRGLQRVCVPCRTAHQAAYRAAHPERVKTWQAAMRKKHRLALRERALEHRWNNIEAVRERDREYQRRRRAAQKGSESSGGGLCVVPTLGAGAGVSA